MLSVWKSVKFVVLEKVNPWKDIAKFGNEPVTPCSQVLYTAQ